jgi:hypothetical protein
VTVFEETVMRTFLLALPQVNAIDEPKLRIESEPIIETLPRRLVVRQ